MAVALLSACKLLKNDSEMLRVLFLETTATPVEGFRVNISVS